MAGETPANKLPAFPGAEGYGAVAKGGRGGKVYKVTNLNPSGPGSLQEACKAEGPRIVVFEVSGVITPNCRSGGKNWLSIKPSFITIAGQTAPGAGITINGMVSSYRSTSNGEKKRVVTDLIMRFIRIRPQSPSGGRASNLRGMENKAKRAIFDHVSASWSTDDCFCLGSGPTTAQWCAIEESDIHLEGGDEPHNFAMLMTGSGHQPLSIHHSLIAHHNDRTPECGTAPTDFRNNIVYNGSSGRFTHKSGPISCVGNYLKAGPGGLIGRRAYRPPLTAGLPTLSFKKGRNFYGDGNYRHFSAGYTDPWKGKVRKKDHDVHPAVTTHTAEEAYELVLAHAGGLPRDVVSTRTSVEVATGTGYRGYNGSPGGLMEGLTPGKAPKDSDNDGMPDEWEKAHKLDPADPADNNKIVPAGASPGDRHKDYTWIEYYINELADLKVAAVLTRARLDRKPVKPWDKPANELSPGSAPHKSLESIVKAIAEQDANRQKDKRRKYSTSSAWYAVQQLSRMGEKAKPAVPEFVKMLQKGKADPRQTCYGAWALGAIGPAAKDAVPELIKALEAEQNMVSAKWSFKPYGFIAWALGRIGMSEEQARKAAPVLAKKMLGADARAHNGAAWALSKAPAAAAEVMPDLIKALGVQGFPSEYTSYHAAQALAAVGEPAIDGLIKAAGGSGIAAANAAQALGWMGPKAKAAVPALAKALASGDVPVKIRAAQALPEIDPSAAGTIEALGKALGDGAYGVRCEAARSIAKCGPAAKGAIPALQKALADERREVKRAAALALGGIGKAALPALQKALAGSDSFVRKYAARALGNVGKDAAGAVDALAKALSDTDAEVRREAAWSLALIGPAAKGAGDALTKAQKDDSDYVVRFAAAEALKRANQ